MTRRRIKMAWTCCDHCHAEHSTLASAWLHHKWITSWFTQWDEWRGDLDGNVTMWIKHLVHFRGYKVDLHKMVAPDRDGCFHSHPAKAIRVVFWGGYVEELFRSEPIEGLLDVREFVCLLPGSVSVVRPRLIHRIDALVNDKCSYSIWMRWPKTHEIELHGSGWTNKSGETLAP